MSSAQLSIQSIWLSSYLENIRHGWNALYEHGLFCWSIEDEENKLDKTGTRWFDKAGNWESLFSSWERTVIIYLGAAAMYFIGKKLKKKHQLKPDVRETLYDEINFWLRTIRCQCYKILFFRH
jgi:hypothetical protein